MYAWESFLRQQEVEFGKETTDRWLRTLTVVNFDACNLFLEAQDSFHLMWVEEHIRPKLMRFANNNNTPIHVHITVKGQQKHVKTKYIKNKKKAFPDNAFTITFEELDPTHTFDQFIVTEPNLIVSKFLKELCQNLQTQRLQNIADKKSFSLPKDFSNPIVLYGPGGSGKTHLLMAMGHMLKSFGYQVLYTRAEAFTDHVVRAIRTAEMAAFREIYRKADILLIDDVHALAKKNATQEEFFHTFNTLHTAGKQIILSTNIAPGHLQNIEQRLISRFEWGISLTLDILDKKTIRELIEKRAAFLQLPIHPHTAEFLAETFPSNVKSAMRAMQALMLRSHLAEKGKATRGAIPLSQAKMLIHDLIEEERAEQLTAEKIINSVANHYGIRFEDITGKSQSRECVIPRQLSMYLCRHLLKMPYMKIGDFFTRDHSTVMSAIRLVDTQLNLEASDLKSSKIAIEQSLSNRR